MALVQTPRLSSRSARLYTIAVAVLLPVGEIGLIVRPWPLSAAMEAALAAIFLAALVFAAVVMIGTPGWRREAKGTLDERETVDTAKALSLSYRIIGLLLMAFTLWYGLATHGNSLGLPEPSASIVLLLLINLMWLHLILPSTILAWRDTAETED